MTWFEAIPAVLVCVGWLVLLGVPVTYASGLRGIAAWALGPVIAVLLIAGSAVVAGLAGIGWSVWVPVITAVVVTAGVAAGAFLLRKRAKVVADADPLRVSLAAGLGLLPAFVLGAIAIVVGFGRPDNLSQTFDALFHYNAVALILDGNSASSLSISTFGTPGVQGNFYPAAWHGITSLVVMTTGTSIPVATNVLAGVVATVVWPLTCVFLARQIFGRTPAALAVTGALSVAFSASPWGLLGFGVLWPNALGLSLLPAAIGVVLSLTGLAKDDAVGRGRAALLLPVVLISVVFAHPGSLFSLIVLSIFPVAQLLTRRAILGYRAGRSWRALIEPVVVVGLAGAVWYWTVTTSSPMFASVRSIVWAPFETPSRATGEVLLNATNGRQALWLVSALVIVGLVTAFRESDRRWLLGAHAASAALYVLTASINRPDTIKFTGYWYNDSYRLAAMLPITAVPLAVAGVLFIAGKLTERAAGTKAASWRALRSPVAVAVALVALLALLTQGLHAPDRTERLDYAYRNTGPTDLLTSPDQREFFAEVRPLIPEDAVVANNPWDGSAMLWALADRRTLFPHFSTPVNADKTYLAEHLDDVASDPLVCQAVNRLNVDFLLIGDAKFWPWDGRSKEYPGLADPGQRPGFELVKAEGGRKLYRITACAAADQQSR